jgi:ABC-type multidrug transport system ATPase subunit
MSPPPALTRCRAGASGSWSKTVRSQRPQLTLLVATAYMEEAEQFEHCLMLDRGKLIAAGLSEELAAASPSGKLDEAFTHYQGDSGHSNEPLVIPPRVKRQHRHRHRSPRPDA